MKPNMRSDNRYTKEILEESVKRNETWAGVIRDLKGTGSHGGGLHAHLRGRAEAMGIDYSHFKGRSWSRGTPSPKRVGAEDILKRQHGERLKPPATHYLRKSLLEIGVPHRCSLEGCPVGTTWNSKELVLQVDHINGDKFDCRAENLRFICPNCHSQTSNWGIKNSKGYNIEPTICQGCSRETKERGSTRCASCAQKEASKTRAANQERISWPSIEQLQSMMTTMSMVAISKQLGCSDNAVRKFMKKKGAWVK